MEIYKEKEHELRNVIDSTLSLNYTFETYVEEVNRYIDILTTDIIKQKQMSSLSEKESLYLEEILNEAIKDYLDSGYRLDDDYVITMRNMLSKFGLKESYPYDKWYKKEEE